MDTNCGVYLIVSPSNGKYIGSSNNIKKRWSRYKNLSCNSQPAILSSLRKYGAENHKFSILFNCERGELLFWERVFGDLYLSLADFPNGLNISLPSYDDKPASRTKSFVENVSRIQTRRFSDPQERLKTSIATKKGFTPEVRQKMSEVHTERFTNPELRQQRSQLRKQYFQSQEARDKASQLAKQWVQHNPEKARAQYNALTEYYKLNPDKRGIYAKTVIKGNKEYAAAQSKRLKEYYQNNPEARILASEKSKQQFADPANHPQSKKVINIETGELFSCANTVAAKLGVAKNTFRNWLKGISPNNTPYRYQHLL